MSNVMYEEPQPKCELCGQPMPEGEEMFKYHGYSGPCPKPQKGREQPAQAEPPCIGIDVANGSDRSAYWCAHCKQEVSASHRCTEGPVEGMSAEQAARKKALSIIGLLQVHTGDIVDGEKFNTAVTILASELQAYSDALARQILWSGFCEDHLPNKSQQYNACWRCSREEESRTVAKLREAALREQELLARTGEVAQSLRKQIKELREERDALKRERDELKRPFASWIARCERAESALASAREALQAIVDSARDGRSIPEWLDERLVSAEAALKP